MPKLCIFPARGLEDPTLSLGTDIRVLAAISKHTNARTGVGCWAYSRTLAREAGVSRSSFFESTKRLIAAGLIRRDSGKLRGQTSVYSILLDASETTVCPAGEGVSSPIDTPVRRRVHRKSAASDTPTINNPFNVPKNAPDTMAALQTKGERVFADILKQTKYNSTANGSRPYLPKEIIDALPDPARQAWSIIGGTSAVLAADQTGVRVLQGRFGRHFASEWSERRCAGKSNESTGLMVEEKRTL